MASVLITLSMSGFLCSRAAEKPARKQVREEISRAARRHGVDAKLADAVAQVESGYQHHVVSRVGAVGVMQLMPATARTLGVNPHDEAENIDGGVRYLGMLLQRYNGDLRSALAAYNAGPSTVEAHGGVPPFRETQRYVDNVMSLYQGHSEETRDELGCASVELGTDSVGRVYYRSRSVPPGCLPTR